VKNGGRLFIASPSFTGEFRAEFVESLVGTIKDCAQNGIKTLFKPFPGLHWIDIARDVIAHVFLHTDCTHMLQIDADLGWPAEAARRLLEHDKDVIGGAYPVKSDEVNLYPVHCEPGQGLVRATGLPGGFLMVRRNVIETMSERPKYGVSVLGYGHMQVAPLFTREFRDGGYTGEDFMFCERAAGHGFELWLDPDIEFAHVGPKAWRGTYRDVQ
jgi:hypothetical protein